MFISVHLHPLESKNAKVILDGVDISRDCYAANDKLGIALCYKRNESGSFYHEQEYGEELQQCMVREMRKGNITIVLQGEKENGR